MEIKKEKLLFDTYETRRFTIPVDAKEAVGENITLLCCTAAVSTGRCEMLNNEALVEGTVCFRAVLRDGQGEIRTVERTERFAANETVSGAKPSSGMLAQGKAKNVKAYLEAGNLLFSCEVLVEGILMMPFETEAVTSATGDDAKVLQGELCAEKTVFRAPLRFTVTDSGELSMRLPEAEEILSVCATAAVTEARSLEGQLMLGGSIYVSTLYASNDEYEPLTQVNDTLEFSQILDVSEAITGYSPQVALTVEEISARVLPDGEGEKRHIEYNVMLSGWALATESVHFTAVHDLYSTASEISCESRHLALSCDSAPAQAAASERIAVHLPARQQPMARILAVQTSAAFDEVNCQRGRAEAIGNAEVSVLYVTAGTGEISGFNATVPLRVCFDAQELEEGCSLTGNIVLTQMQAALLSGSEAEVRATFEARFDRRMTREMDLLTDAEEKGRLEEPEYGLVVYIVHGGDTLWDVCKRFHADEDEVRKLNPGCGDALMPESKLYIFRRLRA